MKRHILLTTCLSVCCSFNTYAQIHDNNGWNLGTGVALSYHQYGIAVDDFLLNAHISAGYRFNRYLGLEARVGKGFTDIELVDFEKSVEQGLYYSGYLKGMYPLMSGWTPYLLLGAQNSEINIDPNTTTDTSMSYGFGVSYRLKAKTVDVDVGLEAINAFQHGDIDYDIWDFGLKIGYQF